MGREVKRGWGQNTVKMPCLCTFKHLRCEKKRETFSLKICFRIDSKWTELHVKFILKVSFIAGVEPDSQV